MHEDERHVAGRQILAKEDVAPQSRGLDGLGGDAGQVTHRVRLVLTPGSAPPEPRERT